MVISVMTSSPKVVSSTSNAEMRKIKKPLIERKRRERINHSLAELKMLVLEARNKDESCYSKMEKADILEMTVDHLKQLQAQTKLSIIDSIPEHIDASYLHSAYPSIPKLKDNPIDSTQAKDVGPIVGTADLPFKSSQHHHLFLGYSECVQRVQECLETLNLKVSLRQSLMKHLQSYLPVRSTHASKIHQHNLKTAQRSHKNRKVSANLKTKLQNPYHVQSACQQMMRDNFQNSNDRQRCCSSFENLFFKNSIQVWRPWNTC